MIIPFGKNLKQILDSRDRHNEGLDNSIEINVCASDKAELPATVKNQWPTLSLAHIDIDLFSDAIRHKHTK